MANLQGYGTNSVGNMLNHYTRHAGDPEQTKYRYANQDIDQTRTHLNYAIFARDDPAAFVQSKIDEVDVKPKGGDKATNVISDWVITLPKNPGKPSRQPADAPAAPAPDSLVDSLAAQLEIERSRNAELMEALAAERDRAARAEAEAKAQLAEANARVAELAGKLASLAERQQAIAATPWWRRGRMAMKLLGPGRQE